MSFYIPKINYYSKIILFQNVSFIVNVKTNTYYGTHMRVLQEMEKKPGVIWELYAGITRNV
jgi:hypothetical protein